MVAPPLKFFYEPWKADLKKALEKIKPDIVLAQIFSVATMEVADSLGLKIVITAGLTVNSLFFLGLPNFYQNFCMLGYTVVEPYPPVVVFKKHSHLIQLLSQFIVKKVVILSSFVGFDKPYSISPNIRLSGLGVDKSQPQIIPVDIEKWLQMIRKKNLGIIYVTFGSQLFATPEFIRHMYEALKKQSLRENQNVNEDQNELFMIKQWLPQKDLLKLRQVKLVITHCGYGGITQIIDAEKPILGMPVFADQPFNAERVLELGIGLILRRSPNPYGAKQYRDPCFTIEQLVDKVNTIVSDNNFVLRVRRLKQIGLKNGGVERTCEWIEEVGVFGEEHLIGDEIKRISERVPATWPKKVLFGLLTGGLLLLGYKYKDQLQGVKN